LEQILPEPRVDPGSCPREATEPIHGRGPGPRLRGPDEAPKEDPMRRVLTTLPIALCWPFAPEGSCPRP
jgi:hypothetical protein